MTRWRRNLGLTRGWAYLAICAGVALILLGEGESDGKGVSAVVLQPASLAVLFVWGTAGWSGSARTAARIGGWAGMAAGSILLISFSFIIWPLLLIALPALWPAGAGHQVSANGGARGR